MRLQHRRWQSLLFVLTISVGLGLAPALPAAPPAKGTVQKYFTMRDPVIRGLNLEGPNDLRLLKSLGYAIVQKNKLSYVYDFS